MSKKQIKIGYWKTSQNKTVYIGCIKPIEITSGLPDEQYACGWEFNEENNKWDYFVCNSDGKYFCHKNFETTELTVYLGEEYILDIKEKHYYKTKRGETAFIVGIYSEDFGVEKEKYPVIGTILNEEKGEWESFIQWDIAGKHVLSENTLIKHLGTKVYFLPKRRKDY